MLDIIIIIFFCLLQIYVVLVVVIAPFVQWWYPVMLRVIPGRSALAVLGRVVMDQISGRTSALCSCFYRIFSSPIHFLLFIYFLLHLINFISLFHIGSPLVVVMVFMASAILQGEVRYLVVEP